MSVSAAIEVHSRLYHRDSKGNLRVWYVETSSNGYRTVAGLVGGLRVTSGWTYVQGKNIGKSNESTPVSQMVKEVKALYDHKLTRKYAKSIEALEAKDIAFPMLAAKYEPEKFKWERDGLITCYTQPKLDGIRCLARWDSEAKKVTLWSRQGRQHVGFTEIERELYLTLKSNPDVILDGELYNHQLRSEFNTIVSAVRGGHEELKGSIQYHVYDVFGAGLTDTAFVGRIDWLRQNLPAKDSTVIKLVTTLAIGSQLSLNAQYETFLSQGYEGQMVRLPFEPYHAGKRSKSLLKRKEWMEEEFRVVRLLEGTGNWAGKARKAELQVNSGSNLEDGFMVCEADIVGSYAECAKYWADWQAGWRPKEATTTFFGYTPAGALRFGKVRTLWTNGRDL
jgi:ATP-dependent DNA ligase